jgi:toxin ParE1/3/4
MSPKSVRARLAARRDVEEAVAYYADEAGEAVAHAFADAVATALHVIGEHPGAGSPRYGQELELPGLRSLVIPRFPYVAFYVERADHIELWRVLHAKRDIPAWLPEP